MSKKQVRIYRNYGNVTGCHPACLGARNINKPCACLICNGKNHGAKRFAQMDSVQQRVILHQIKRDVDLAAKMLDVRIKISDAISDYLNKEVKRKSA